MLIALFGASYPVESDEGDNYGMHVPERYYRPHLLDLLWFVHVY